MMRARIGAFALAVAAAGTLAATVMLAPAQATTSASPSAGLAAAATVTSTSGNLRLEVDPTVDLPAAGAAISVEGEGYPAGATIYVAVCPAGARAPTNLTGCVGAPVSGKPDSGPIVVQDVGPDGKFEATLTLPADASATTGCVPDKCALFTVDEDQTKTDADMKVAVTFKSPTSSSSAPPTPSSAIVQQVGSPTIAPGATQQVIFSGFKGGEQVNLTLFSDPVVLSPVTADSTGVARVDFVVPADFVDGTHRLEAIGAQSGTVGVASFQVVVPTPTPTPSPTPTPTPTPSPSPTTTSPSATTTSPAPTTASPTTTAAASGGDSGGSNNWWIWLILALIVIAGLITWFVVYRRNKEQARAEQEKQLADAATRQQGYDPMANAPTMVLPPTNPPPGPPPGADPYGLLSGRNHPYGVDPNAPTEYDRPGPTQYIPPGPTEYIGGGPTQVIPPGQGGPGQGGPGQGGPGQGGPGQGGPGPGGPGQGGPGQSGPGQSGPGQSGAPTWEVPPEFAGDTPGTGRPAGTPSTGSDRPPAGQGPGEGPRTQRFRPDLGDGHGDDDEPDPPTTQGPRR